MPTVDELQAELEALKAAHAQQLRDIVNKAREVAKDNELCSVIDGALVDMGLLGDTVIKDIDILVPVTVRLEMDQFFLSSLTADETERIMNKVKFERIVWNDEMVGAVNRVSLGRTEHSQPITSVQNGNITLVEVRDADGVLQSSATPEFGQWRYTSNEGRVQHFFLGSATSLDNYNNYVSSICTRVGGYSPVVDSARGENRRCASCEGALGRLTDVDRAGMVQRYLAPSYAISA